MNAIAGTDVPHTMRDLDDAAAFVDGVAFPAMREDLLLHAIVTHATPRLIGALRSLPDIAFADGGSVVEALGRA